MGKFQFKNYSRTLEFPGCEFTIVCNSDLGDAIFSKKSVFDELAAKKKKGEISKDEIIEYVKKTIDEILGEGATDKIFSGRTMNLTDASDVLVFIINEVNAANKQTSNSHRLPGSK